MTAGLGVASAEELGSDGVTTGAMEVSGAQTEEAEASARSMYGTAVTDDETLSFLTNDGAGYTLQGRHRQE